MRSKSLVERKSDNTELELLLSEKEAIIRELTEEVNYLKKQVSGTATASDTQEFINKLKDSHKKRTDELESMIEKLNKEKQSKDKEIDDLRKKNKQLRSDLDKTLNKETLKELIAD